MKITKLSFLFHFSIIFLVLFDENHLSKMGQKLKSSAHRLRVNLWQYINHRLFQTTLFIMFTLICVCVCAKAHRYVEVRGQPVTIRSFLSSENLIQAISLGTLSPHDSLKHNILNCCWLTLLKRKLGLLSFLKDLVKVQEREKLRHSVILDTFLSQINVITSSSKHFPLQGCTVQPLLP